MLENLPVKASAMPASNDAQASRMRQLKRAYQRALGRKPTVLEQVAMVRAAQLTARAEAAMLDPNVCLEWAAPISG